MARCSCDAGVMVGAPATPRNVAAVRDGTYPAMKEAPAVRREGDELQWVGKCQVWGRERERVKLGLLLCISINRCIDIPNDLGHISVICVMHHKYCSALQTDPYIYICIYQLYFFQPIYILSVFIYRYGMFWDNFFKKKDTACAASAATFFSFLVIYLTNMVFFFKTIYSSFLQ